MPLTGRQRERFQHWATARGITHSCPACGIPELTLSDEMTTVYVQTGDPEFAGGSVVKVRSEMPLVQVICENCAYTMFFAAGIIGMVQEGMDEPIPVG